MKKYSYLIIIVLISGLVLTGCSLLSNIGQAPATGQSGVTYLTKGLPSGLVGWWRFSNNALDSSGNGNDGTVNGATSYVDSPMGQALSFNGIDNYVSVGNIGVTEDWTVEFWARLASTDKTIYYPIGLSLTNSWGSGIFVAYIGDKWGVYDGVSVVYGSQVSINTWYHFAVTKSGTTYTLYLNGDYESTGSLADIDVTDLNIGRRSDNYWYFDGTIDDVRIWNVALLQDQLGKVYNFNGFFPPVDILPMWNSAKAGSAIPVKFSLNGDQGLDIFAADYPTSLDMPCGDPTALVDGIDEIVTAGKSSLSYDATDDQYIYVWKTDKNWANTCRQLVVKLIDGTYHRANFKFKK